MCPNPQDVSSEHHPSLVSFFLHGLYWYQTPWYFFIVGISTVHITNQIRSHVFEPWLLDYYQVEGFPPLWFLPQPSKTESPFIVMWSHGLDWQSPLDYFVINVFFCFHHQEELGGPLFIFVGDLAGFNFIVETLGHCVYDTNVRIFSNCFFRQTSFKSVGESY